MEAPGRVFRNSHLGRVRDLFSLLCSALVFNVVLEGWLSFTMLQDHPVLELRGNEGVYAFLSLTGCASSLKLFSPETSSMVSRSGEKQAG